jgi:hypothetical protein
MFIPCKNVKHVFLIIIGNNENEKENLLYIVPKKSALQSRKMLNTKSKPMSSYQYFTLSLTTCDLNVIAYFVLDSKWIFQFKSLSLVTSDLSVICYISCDCVSIYFWFWFYKLHKEYATFRVSVLSFYFDKVCNHIRKSSWLYDVY